MLLMHWMLLCLKQFWTNLDSLSQIIIQPSTKKDKIVLKSDAKSGSN